MRQLRPYQADCIDSVKSAFKRGLKAVVIEAFTGFGKGLVIAAIAKMVIAKGGRVLVAVNRDNLVEQLTDSLIEQGLWPVMERGQDKASPLSDCVVGSIQTMQGNRLKKWKPDHFRLVVTDEVHGAGSNTFKAMLDHFKFTYHLGCSATIERHDKKGLWKGYEECVYTMTLTEGIADGWLVPFQFEELPVPIVIDDDSARKRMWTEQDETNVFNKEDYLPRLFSEAALRSHGRKALFFWPNCKSSEEAANHFAAQCIESYHIDGYMSKIKIAQLLDWFKSPGPKSLHNADLLSLGYDNPSIDCIGIMRLSRSIPMLKQRLGRGTRPLCRVDDYPTAELRREAIAISPKPYTLVLDLMIQLGDVKNKFADPTALITDNEEECQFLRKEREAAPLLKYTAEELASKLRVKRQVDHDKALAKLAEDAANAAERHKAKRNYDGPYIADILDIRDLDSPSATEPQKRFLWVLGMKGIGSIQVSKRQASQLINRWKRYNDKMEIAV